MLSREMKLHCVTFCLNQLSVCTLTDGLAYTGSNFITVMSLKFYVRAK